MKILKLFIVFVLFAAVGFLLPVDTIIEQFGKTGGVESPQQSQSQLQSLPQPEPEPEPMPEPVKVEPQEPAKPMVMFSIKDVTIYGLRKVSTTDKLYYRCEISVDNPEDSKLQYNAYPAGSERVITSKWPSFTNLPPVEGGVYEFSATDLDTGEESERFSKSGFDKIQKMSSERLESILNVRTALPKDFYNYLVKDVKINTLSIFSEAGYENVAPTCCDHIFTGVKYSDWNVSVSNIRYNNDNRITQFSVTITKK